MAVPLTQIRLEDVRIELGLTAPTSLGACIAAAGKTGVWNKLSDFAGYNIGLIEFSLSDTKDSPPEACDSTLFYTMWHNGSGINPTIGDTVYTDSSGNSELNGQNKWHSSGLSDEVYQISVSGEVININSCV